MITTIRSIFKLDFLLDLVKIFVITFLIIVTYSSRNFLYWKFRKVPYITPIPIFGNFFKVLTFQTDIFHHAIDLYKKIPEKYFGIWFLDKPMLILKDPDLIKLVLVKDFDYFAERTVTLDPKIDKIGSKLLFFAKAPFWETARKKIITEFNLKRHKNLIHLMQESIDNIIKSNLEQETSINAKEVFQEYSASILATCIFGTDPSLSKFFKDIGEEMFTLDFNNAIRGTSHFFFPWLSNLLRMTFAKPEVYEGLRKTLARTIEQRSKGRISQDLDYVDALIEIEKCFIKEDNFPSDGTRPAAYAIQSYLAGIESISSIIALALYELCLNVELQNKLRAEILAEINNFGKINYECLMSMRYLHNCVSETLRKYPGLAFIDRICTKTYKIPGSKTIIEKGTSLYIFLLGLHYDPKFYPDPEKFDPERFSDDNKQHRSQYAYLPFGHGPHNCIGQRFSMIAIKLALVNILSNFQVTRNQHTPVPLKFDPKCFLLKIESGLFMDYLKLNDTKKFFSE